MTAPTRGIMQSLTVPVDGGELAVTRWPGDGPPVIALHGITANSLAFAAVAEALPDTDFHAPDLRGRAASAALPGPYGLTAHVRDILALLDHLGRQQAVLLGHSMGAFVAALAAARHPKRFPHVVLVDGGLGFPVPTGADIDELLQAVIGPAMDRLSMTFEDREAYLEFFRAHPALAPHWSPQLAAYVDRDLTGRSPELRSSCVLDAVRADGADVLSDPEALAAIHQPHVHGTLLWAERGLLNEPQALYDPGRIAAASLDPDRMPARCIGDTNHYSILFPPAAGEVATAVRASTHTSGRW
ncbi:alpha/beta fold hydrolase [Streptomyces sp. TE5632]